MRTLFAALIALSMPAAALASSFSYECSRFGDYENRLEINLNKEKAVFSDAEGSYTLKQVAKNVLESNPPQIQYVFAIKSGRDVLRIYFNETRLTATMVGQTGDNDPRDYGTVKCIGLE